MCAMTGCEDLRSKPVDVRGNGKPADLANDGKEATFRATLVPQADREFSVFSAALHSSKQIRPRESLPSGAGEREEKTARSGRSRVRAERHSELMLGGKRACKSVHEFADVL